MISISRYNGEVKDHSMAHEREKKREKLSLSETLWEIYSTAVLTNPVKSGYFHAEMTENKRVAFRKNLIYHKLFIRCYFLYREISYENRFLWYGNATSNTDANV